LNCALKNAFVSIKRDKGENSSAVPLLFRLAAALKLRCIGSHPAQPTALKGFGAQLGGDTSNGQPAALHQTAAL